MTNEEIAELRAELSAPLDEEDADDEDERLARTARLGEWASANGLPLLQQVCAWYATLQDTYNEHMDEGLREREANLEAHNAITRVQHETIRELVDALRPFAEPKAAQHWNVYCDRARALVGKYGATASPSPPHPAASTTAEDDD